MSADTDSADARPNGMTEAPPSTPPDAQLGGRSLSQQSIASTEGPPSPVDPTSSFKTELNDDRMPSSQVIPSSLTPPPSSQIAQNAANGTAGHPLGYVSSQRTNRFSPPATTSSNNLRRDGTGVRGEYIPPTAEQIQDVAMEELRNMFQACLAENARLKMETAHHKLQYNLLSMHADEEAKRAAVENEMTRREVEVLRLAEDSRQARRELSTAAENIQAKYIQLKATYEAACDEIDVLRKSAKLAKKVIQQKEDEILGLADERQMLLTRIRENRDHFYVLRAPGGALHEALTPKQQSPAMATPQKHRATPRQTPKSSSYYRDSRHENDTQQAGFAALLQAVSHENNSAPSTPISATRPAPRLPPKHTRGVQSMSSLPSTPIGRARGEHSALLPSADLVPQTEPSYRYGTNRFTAETSNTKRGHRSRESTISAEDNEDLSKLALESVAAAANSFMSHASGGSASRSRRRDGGEELAYESQASQAASEMLRRDPRESFDEVASSVGSRDGTPIPTEKSVKLQARLFAPLNKSGLGTEKRKHSGKHVMGDPASQQEALTSPSKRMRHANGADASQRVGLGIQYSR